MRYLFALFLPPIAVLMCGKVGQAFLNIILTVCGIVPGIIHAILVVNKFYTDKRHAEMLAMMQRMQMPR